jgi:uncharacterized phage-like protein YoqJ
MVISFTGHRPDKLGGYDWNTSLNQQIMCDITEEVDNIIDSHRLTNDFHVICGGALGTDQMAFHVCNKLKIYYDNLTTEIAVPYKNQPNVWKDSSDIERYNLQLSQADNITYVDKLERYKVTCMINGEDNNKHRVFLPEDIYDIRKLQKRNEYMADNADIVIAVYNGSRGGTNNMINYARKMHKEIVVINPDNIRRELGSYKEGYKL